MLSVARNALGFWGANQILMELERLNMKRASPEVDAEWPDTRPVERSERTTSDAGEPPGKKVPPPAGLRQKAGKSVDRDLMFA